jgi:hypothetical protein
VLHHALHENCRVFSRVKVHVTEGVSEDFAMVEVGSLYDGSRLEYSVRGCRGRECFGGGPEDLDSLGLTWTVADMDTWKVGPSGVDAHKRGGALLVVGAAPALAKGTASVEPAGKGKTTAAKPEALVPWTQGVAECEVEMLLGEGKHVHESPPVELS